MQFVAITTGDVGKHGDHVFFVFGFVDDHFFFQRFQLCHQSLIGHVDRLSAADVIHRPLQNVFAIFGNVDNAAVGRNSAQAVDWCLLNIGIFHAQFIQRGVDCRIISMHRGAHTHGNQGEQQ